MSNRLDWNWSHSMLLHVNPLELESLYVRPAGLELESLHVTPH